MKTEIKTRKTIPLVGGAEANVDLLMGKQVITFSLTGIEPISLGAINLCAFLRPLI